MTAAFRTIAIAATIVTLFSGAAMARPDGASKPQKVLDPNEMICTSEPELGSRLVRHKTCMTRAERAERRRNDRQLVERTQTQLCVAQGGACLGAN